jgi:glycerol uptake facilitator-like aquaporin
MVDEVGNARAAPFNQQICSLLRTATPVWNDSEVLSTWFGINFTLYDADLPAGICGLLSSLYSTTWSAVTADIKSNVRFTGVTPLAVLFKCIKLFNGGTIGNKMTYTALNTA